MTRLLRYKWLIPLIVMMTAAAGPTAAQGVVIGPDGRPVMLELRKHRFEADVQERLAVVTVEHETAGRLRLPRPVVRFVAAPREIRRPPPRLGEHGAEILAEIGVSDAEIASLRGAGVLG